MVLKVTVSGAQEAKAEVRKKIRDLMKGNKFVAVGIQEDAGLHSEGLTNAKVGAINHFGTEDGHIPPRPWLDVGVESGNPEYLEIIQDGFSDGLSLDQILNKVGVVAVSKVQEYMTELRDPPNSDQTIKRKGSSNPLIDTGELRQSVTYKIENSAPPEGL